MIAVMAADGHAGCKIPRSAAESHSNWRYQMGERRFSAGWGQGRVEVGDGKHRVPLALVQLSCHVGTECGTTPTQEA